MPGKSIPALGDAFIAHYDALSAKNLLPFLPPELGRVPRANVKFLAIENAWFSGSMNYLGHARRSGRFARVRGDVRAQRLAPDLRPRVPAAREPRGRAGTRHDVRVPAGPLRARARRFRGVRPHDEHARGRPLRGHREQRRPRRARDHRGPRPARPGPPDRSPPRAPAGRREEPLVLPDVEGEAFPRPRSRRRSGTISSSRRSARTSSRARGAGTRSSGACTYPPTAPAPSSSRGFAGNIRRKRSCRRCTA